MYQALTFAYEIFLARRRDEIFVSNLPGQRVLKKTQSNLSSCLSRSETERYFYYLIPENRNEEASPDEEWHGRLAKLERVIKKEALNTEQSLARNFAGQFNSHSKQMKELMAMCSETASLVQKMANQSEETETWKKRWKREWPRLRPLSTNFFKDRTRPGHLQTECGFGGI